MIFEDLSLDLMHPHTTLNNDNLSSFFEIQVLSYRLEIFKECNRIGLNRINTSIRDF